MNRDVMGTFVHLNTNLKIVMSVSNIWQVHINTRVEMESEKFSKYLKKQEKTERLKRV